MSSRPKNVVPSTVSVYEDGIECTPETLFKAIAGCFGVLSSMLIVAGLGVTAAGVFWTAD